MRVDDYNKKFNLEDEYPGEEDELNDENAMTEDDEDYNEDERDEEEGDSPPSISSLGVFIPFICS
jgi:hypothetical protein